MKINCRFNVLSVFRADDGLGSFTEYTTTTITGAGGWLQTPAQLEALADRQNQSLPVKYLFALLNPGAVTTDQRVQIGNDVYEVLDVANSCTPLRITIGNHHV